MIKFKIQIDSRTGFVCKDCAIKLREKCKFYPDTVFIVKDKFEDSNYKCMDCGGR